MKLFLVLVLATVAMCHPSRKGKANDPNAYLSYNPDRVVEEAKKAVRPSRQLFKGKKAPAEPYKHEELLDDPELKIVDYEDQLAVVYKADRKGKGLP